MSKFIGDVSAYAYAVSKGYTGTEEEFAELMASYADVGQTAVDAKDAAVAAKTAAQTAATTATSKASEATTAAQTATTKAGEASQGASQASASAQIASTKASEASQSASTASAKATEATTAAGTATTAKTDAESAKTAAQTAQAAAETAQGAAEDAAESVSASAAQIAQNTAEINSVKENLSDLESDGVAPSAEQLLSKNTTADAVPYHFRATGGNGADREYVDAIVGGTMCWNQLVDFAQGSTKWKKNGDITTTWNNGVLILNNAASDSAYLYQAFEAVLGHKYLISCDSFSDGNAKVQLYEEEGGFINFALPSSRGYSACIFNVTQALTNRIQLRPNSTTATITCYSLMLFDLTAMFGSTIADYIYSLEQSTAGAGVALFKSLFPNDYYPYNAGELQSVSGLSEHKTVGFNQWDEEWETGGYNSDTGNPESVATRIRSKNYIPVISGQSYFFSYQSGSINGFGLVWILYDADKNYISGRWMSNSLFPFTIPDGCAYVRFSTGDTYGGVYKNDICINLSDPAKNGTYEPYVKHSYPLDSSLTLRGIPKLSDGKMYYDGDRYLPDGKVERRYGVVDLGTLNWQYNSSLAFFQAELSNILGVAYASIPNIICPKYLAGSVASVRDGSMAGISANTGNVFVRDSSYTDAAAFKSALSGVMLVCELATPTTEEADPYQHLQQCDPNGIEEFVSTGIVPVGHNTKYPDNMRAKLDGLPWNFATLIAPTESGYTATRNYTTGALLIVNNVLYKATANIANGATITVGTNVTATTLAEVISALS